MWGKLRGLWGLQLLSLEAAFRSRDAAWTCPGEAAVAGAPTGPPASALLLPDRWASVGFSAGPGRHWRGVEGEVCDGRRRSRLAGRSRDLGVVVAPGLAPGRSTRLPARPQTLEEETLSSQTLGQAFSKLGVSYTCFFFVCSNVF